MILNTENSRPALVIPGTEEAHIVQPMLVQQIRDIDQILDQCWATVYDDGPTLGQCVVFAVY